MKLSERNRKVLSVIQHDSTMSDRDAAPLAGMSAHAVARARSQLIDSGVIAPSLFVNPFRMGLQDFDAYFSLTSSDKNARAKLVRFLANDLRVSWVVELGGDFDLGIAATVSRASEFSDLIKDLGKLTSGAVIHKRVAMEIALTRFGRKFLAPKALWPKPIESSGRETSINIDSLDVDLLNALRCKSYWSWSQVARDLKQPVSTVSYRISRLATNRIILGFPYRINPDALGLFTFRVLIGTSSNQEDKGKRSSVYRFAEQHPAVYGIVETLGAWDWELGLEVSEPREAAAVVRELHQSLGSQVSFVRTIPVFQTHKSSYREIPSL